jgi:hypothetical protein
MFSLLNHKNIFQTTIICCLGLNKAWKAAFKGLFWCKIWLKVSEMKDQVAECSTVLVWILFSPAIIIQTKKYFLFYFRLSIDWSIRRNRWCTAQNVLLICCSRDSKLNNSKMIWEFEYKIHWEIVSSKLQLIATKHSTTRIFLDSIKE